MNTITDLRATLDRHADDVADPAAVARTLAVHHRIAAVRRQRRAAGTGILALAVVAVVGVATLHQSSHDQIPAAPVVLGQRAPATFKSLGYTYRTDGHGETFGTRGTLRLSSSKQPRLFSWTSDGAATVQVTTPDGNVLTSPPRFHDFAVVPPGISGKLSVRVDHGRVGLASYVLTAATPAGYTRDGITFRASVDRGRLLAARVGAGVTELRTSYVAPGGQVAVTLMCSGLPKGYTLNVALNHRGRVSSEGGPCDSDGGFDPGSASSARFPHVGVPGTTVPVRMWVSTSVKDSHVVPASKLPHLRLGVAVYGPVQLVKLGGNEVERYLEYAGHTWALTRSVSGSTDRELSLPGAPVDRVGAMAWSTHGRTTVYFGAGSGPLQGGGSASGGQASIDSLWVPAGQPAHGKVTRGTGTFGIALYQRID
jgi:hypothetical protein